MKVTKHKTESTRIVIEEGDTLEDLWEAVGHAPGGGWPVSIQDGAIVATQPTYH